MLFKALRIYSFDDGFDLPVSELNDKLPSMAFESVADSSVSKAKNYGWYAPAHYAYDDRLIYELGKFTILCLRIEERKIKPAMVGSKLRERIQAHHKKMGEMPKNKEIAQYKEEIESTLLRRIPPQDSFIYAMIDHNKRRILIDSGSSSEAEDFLAFLRKSIGSLKVQRYYSTNAPGVLFTSWLQDEYIEEPFSFGEEAVLKAPGEKESKVSLSNHDLVCDEIACHLNADKLVQQIGLVYDNEISFTIDNDLAVKKLTFLDFDVDLKDSSPIEAFDTTYSIVAAQYQQLIEQLTKVLNK